MDTVIAILIWSCDVLLDHGIFNVALQTLLDKDRKKCPHLKVPLIFQEVRIFLLLYCIAKMAIACDLHL